MAVSKNNKFAFLNSKFKVEIPFKYDEAGFFNNGLVEVEKKHKYGVINKKNKTVIPFIYGYMSYDYEYKVYSVTKDLEKYGYIDRKGKILVPLKYDSDKAAEMLAKKMKK